MWNREYQVSRIRHLKKQSVDICSYSIMMVMKHLIKVFVLVIIASFAIMLFLVKSDNEDQMGIASPLYGLHHSAGSGLDLT